MVPTPRADWEPTAEFCAAFNRRIQRHKRAERLLEKLAWVKPIPPVLKLVSESFWEFAKADASGKAQAGRAKRVMRDKGRNLVLLRRRGEDPQAYLDSLRPIVQILASLREPGRPSKAPFHDLVAFAYLLVREDQQSERTPYLKPLRRFLEVPELGYWLEPGDITRIAYKVVKKVIKGEAHADYPMTAAFCAWLDPSLKSAAIPRRLPVGKVRNGGLVH